MVKYSEVAQISIHTNKDGRHKWGWTVVDDDATIEEQIKEIEDYVSGWIRYSEDNNWRYYQQEQLRSNHDISTWIRIKKMTIDRTAVILLMCKFYNCEVGSTKYNDIKKFVNEWFDDKE